MGGYEREPAPWSLDGIPPDFNGKLLEEDWPRFEPLLENAIRRVPSLAEMEVVRLINGPEAFTPDGEFILGPTDVRGFWVAAGLLRPRPRRRGRNGEARRRVDRRGDAEPRRLAHGLPPLRRRVHDPRVHARAHDRGLLDLLRRQVPRARARGGASAQALARLPAAAGARRRLRREVRLGAGELVRAERGATATRACGRAAGRDATGRLRSAPSTPPAARRPRSSTSRRSPRSRSPGRARPSCSSGSATTASPATSARSRTRRC